MRTKQFAKGNPTRRDWKALTCEFPSSIITFLVDYFVGEDRKASPS